ncbi:minichromosome maintenance protein 10 [Sarotherodon galilaeus]
MRQFCIPLHPQTLGFPSDSCEYQGSAEAASSFKPELQVFMFTVAFHAAAAAAVGEKMASGGSSNGIAAAAVVVWVEEWIRATARSCYDDTIQS